MDVIALVALVLLFAAFYRDPFLLTVAPLSLFILAAFVSMSFAIDSAFIALALSLVVLYLQFGKKPQVSDKDNARLERLEVLAILRENTLESLHHTRRRISEEPERSVKMYLSSEERDQEERVRRIETEMKTFVDEIRKNWE